jgi:hypothetical protein
VCVCVCVYIYIYMYVTNQKSNRCVYALTRVCVLGYETPTET